MSDAFDMALQAEIQAAYNDQRRDMQRLAASLPPYVPPRRFSRRWWRIRRYRAARAFWDRSPLVPKSHCEDS